MYCKDSEVFALENSIENVLNHTKWKNAEEISRELVQENDDKFKQMIKRNQSLREEYAQELFMDDIMERLCTLFPMKYQSDERNANGEKKYKRINGFGR